MRFSKALSEGEVIEKDGYHQCRNCSCKKTTDKGAYRDVSIRMPHGVIYHYYHQNLIVKENVDTGSCKVDNCGFPTSTTKQRINRYIPNKYRVYQKDYEWYVETDNETIPYENGMFLEA